MTVRCERALEVDVAELFADDDSAASREFLAHAEGCEACDAEVRAWRELRRALAEEADHVDDALLLAYADAQSVLTEVERAVVASHLIACASCRDELSVLESIRIEPATAREPGGPTAIAGRALAAARRILWHPGFAYALVLLALVPTLARLQPDEHAMMVQRRLPTDVASVEPMRVFRGHSGRGPAAAWVHAPPAALRLRSRDPRPARRRDDAVENAVLGAAVKQAPSEAMALAEAEPTAPDAASPIEPMLLARKRMGDARTASGVAARSARAQPMGAPEQAAGEDTPASKIAERSIVSSMFATADSFEARRGQRDEAGGVVAFVPGERRLVAARDTESGLVVGFGVRAAGGASSDTDMPTPVYDSDDAEALAPRVTGVEVPAGTRGVELRVLEAGGGRELRYRRDDLTIEAGAAVYLAMRVSADWVVPGTYYVTMHAGGAEAPIAAPLTLTVARPGSPAR